MERFKNNPLLRQKNIEGDWKWLILAGKTRKLFQIPRGSRECEDDTEKSI